MTDVISIRKAENIYYPIASIPSDQEILDGFIWRPELRPKSKEEIISSDNQETKAIENTPAVEEIPAGKTTSPTVIDQESPEETLPVSESQEHDD